MLEVVTSIGVVPVVAFLVSISVQLVRIERLLRVIAIKASDDSISEVIETIKRTQR